MAEEQQKASRYELALDKANQAASTSAQRASVATGHISEDEDEEDKLMARDLAKVLFPPAVPHNAYTPYINEQTKVPCYEYSYDVEELWCASRALSGHHGSVSCGTDEHKRCTDTYTPYVATSFQCMKVKRFRESAQEGKALEAAVLDEVAAELAAPASEKDPKDEMAGKWHTTDTKAFIDSLNNLEAAKAEDQVCNATQCMMCMHVSDLLLSVDHIRDTIS